MVISAEILCIGSELLLGQITNTNAAYLAGELARLGVPHHFQTVVGDNPERIRTALAIAVERAGLVITTGGLGPTADDLTHETLASFFEVPLQDHPEILACIEERYRVRNRVMPAMNAKQAQLPVGAEILPNPVGTAPGILWHPRPGVTILTFPGVPAELKAMWADTAVPFLHAQGWGREIFYSRTLHHWGISESALAEKVEPYFNLINPTVAPYASNGQVKLRITARAADRNAALTLIAPVERELSALAGLDCYGADEDTLSSVVGHMLANRGETLVVAESCTGGMLGELITASKGSSRYFLGGVIAYADEIKTALLGVKSEEIVSQGAVSAGVARQMALGVRERFASDWGVGITGVAGPGGGTETKPVGLVYIGLCGPAGEEVQEYRFDGQRGREWIRRVSSLSALDHLRRQIATLQGSGIMKK
ncbi:MAG: competence/damage-inducible protein A [Gemmatimonadaceae bacterium]|nr:competence/damage-inducible protein A [Gloeobacterales cyanobacterium ES-bin-141]